MNIQILKKLTPPDRCYEVGNQQNGDLNWEELRKDNAKKGKEKAHITLKMFEKVLEHNFMFT